MKVKVTEIVYDTESDGIVHTDLDLPTEMTLTIDNSNDVETLISDAISDKTGWCVEGFNYEIL